MSLSPPQSHACLYKLALTARNPTQGHHHSAADKDLSALHDNGMYPNHCTCFCIVFASRCLVPRSAGLSSPLR
eukprot:6176267-Amphidinium_carterae.4